jgi:F-type H+-transporting ATPase subunit b
MQLLALNPLVKPDIGLLFWTTVTFLILLVLLRKFAWKPILNAVKAREASIDGALAAAEEAKEEMAKLKSDNDRIMKEAREERDALLKEAREIKDRTIAEAKEKAGEEAKRILADAHEQIENQKMAAITELKNQVGEMSIAIAEKILRSELADKGKQEALVDEQLKDFNLN